MWYCFQHIETEVNFSSYFFNFYYYFFLLPFDESKEVLVTTDASYFAVGVFLEDIDSTGRSLGIVAYSSKKKNCIILN